MKIKKTFQTAVATGKVLNNYTENNVDTYSCDYINGLETYSTDETRIGTWIDGKPLYKKVINFGNLPNNTYKEVAHGVQNYDVIFVDFSASYATLNNQQFQGLSSFALGLTTYINLGNVICSTNGDRTSWVAVITIKYTKTTD